MLTFIDVKVFDNSEPDPNIPCKTSLSFSDKTYPDRLCIVGTLPHNAEITFDKANAQKVIDFLQKNIIDKKWQEKQKKQQGNWEQEQ